jgi:hypothetical protein
MRIGEYHIRILLRALLIQRKSEVRHEARDLPNP